MPLCHGTVPQHTGCNIGTKRELSSFPSYFRDLYAAADPQENTINDVYSSEEFESMCFAALEKTHPRDATGL